VLISDVTLRNSPGWVQHYLACDQFAIRGITVESRRKIQNNGGIDIDGCQHVRISGCAINAGDDAIC
jgi:polygalacturonase